MVNEVVGEGRFWDGNGGMLGMEGMNMWGWETWSLGVSWSDVAGSGGS